MKGKFEIAGRTAGPHDPSPMAEAVERFVRGAEPMTAITVRIPERLKHALKQAALDRKTTVKALLIERIEAHLVATEH